ncbi:hypothetical protein [Pseudonocardia sp. KRD291]|uniref:hypothetical protein n=1 Tax=Pseudonocardia sp. KRD291 TaxID=2792007 RepID=UPI001C4A082B|nr:hypothetical protein [Pseudonocardia sp. KRD291]MBW0102250.1 hypothetical protein [Pseudonocardia sp. KRD291]
MRRLLLDLTLAATLLVGFATVQNAGAHLVTGVAFVLLAPFHLLTRRRLVAASVRRRLGGLRAVGGPALLITFLVMLGSGVAQYLLPGSEPAVITHSGSGVLLVVVAVVHVWNRRRRLLPPAPGPTRAPPTTRR